MRIFSVFQVLRWQIVCSASLLAVCLTTSGFTGLAVHAEKAHSSAVKPAATNGGWKVVASPNENLDNSLAAVAAFAPDDVWAVGQYDDNKTVYQPLIEH